MVFEIKKNAGVEEVRTVLRKVTKRGKVKPKNVNTFFGKLPRIEDGPRYQKNLGNEWR